jgi:hypothetical protein
MMEVEHQIITAACEINPGTDQLAEISKLVNNDFDADRLIDLAVRQGTGGLLYRNLKSAGLEDRLDSEFHPRLRAIYYQTVQLNLNLIHNLKQVLQKLNQDNISVILMQGMALLLQVYPDVGTRPMQDIDLWVLPKDYDKLVNALIELGYQGGKLYPHIFTKAETIIDISTHILWADRIKARSLLLKKNQEDIFYSADTIKMEGQQAFCLNPYDQVLYLSLHVIKHHVERLIWLLDIKGLIDSWTCDDWNKLLARASELGLQKTLAQIIFLLDLLLKFQPPVEIMSALQTIPLSRAEKAILGLRRTRDALPEWCQVVLLPSGKELRKRAAFTLETLFPRPEILRQVFAGSPNLKTWQLYWKRSLQLMGFPNSS